MFGIQIKILDHFSTRFLKIRVKSWQRFKERRDHVYERIDDARLTGASLGQTWRITSVGSYPSLPLPLSSPVFLPPAQSDFPSLLPGSKHFNFFRADATRSHLETSKNNVHSFFFQRAQNLHRAFLMRLSFLAYCCFFYSRLYFSSQWVRLEISGFYLNI